MKVILRNPRKEIEVDGRRRVKELLVELDILPSTVTVTIATNPAGPQVTLDGQPLTASSSFVGVAR